MNGSHGSTHEVERIRKTLLLDGLIEGAKMAIRVENIFKKALKTY